MKKIICVLFLACYINVDAQYKDVVAIYESLLAESKTPNPKANLRLADLNYFATQYKVAEKYYAAYLAISKAPAPEVYFRYAQCLKNNKNLAEAENAMKKFNDNIEGYSQKFIKRDYSEEIEENSGRFGTELMAFNTNISEFGAIQIDEKLYYTAFNIDRENVSFFTTNKEGTSTPVPLNFLGINFKENITDFAITKDKKTIYYTKTNPLKGKNMKPVYKLYKANLSEDWKASKEVLLNFNVIGSNMAHATLSQDEKKLYFVADLPDSLGDTDLYSVDILEGDNFSKPENLGPIVNTPYKETFPFVSSNGDFYFCSQGHRGLGGMDVFVLKQEEDGKFKTVYNIGAPINSTSDDFSFCIDDNAKTGYFSSNRPGGPGFDDIYKFTQTQELPNNFKLEQALLNEKDDSPVENAKIIISDLNNKIIQTLASDSDGGYSYRLPLNNIYLVRIEHPDFLPSEFILYTMKGFSYQKSLRILSTKQQINKDDDICKILDTENITYIPRVAKIIPQEDLELRKVLLLLKRYPKMTVAFNTYTDAKGSEERNLKFSEELATAIGAWMTKNGVDKNRITVKGYGETMIINRCKDNVPCTEEEHAANRRFEAIVLSM